MNRAPQMRWLFVIHANDATALRTTLGDLETVRRGSDRIAVVGRSQLAAECRRSSRTSLTSDLAGIGDLTDFTHVVVLSDAARMSGNRWLPELLAVAGDDGAALPATNGAPWPQCPTDAPSWMSTRDDVRDATRRVEQAKRGAHLDVMAGGGPMIVVPTSIFVDACTLGSIPTPAQLIEHVVGRAVTTRIALGAYVHDRTPILLSACMIMKDEIENLPGCLQSLVGLVDDVVIYDTGSTDGSIELARSFGATVIEGYWDDDFSRARNAALAACRGEWVVHLDADEIIEDTVNSGPIMRELLANATNGDVVAVNLFNLEGSRIAPVRRWPPTWWHASSVDCTATGVARCTKSRWPDRAERRLATPRPERSPSCIRAISARPSPSGTSGRATCESPLSRPTTTPMPTARSSTSPGRS